jgi:hypothetical protein
MSRRAAIAFGAAHFATGLLVAWGVFRCLPARWAPVDVGAAVVTLLELAAGTGLVGRSSWGAAMARTASVVALAAGLLVVTLLAGAASWLAGVYGPVGTGGAAILVLVAALVLPYLVVLPCLELAWLGPRGSTDAR